MPVMEDAGTGRVSTPEEEERDFDESVQNLGTEDKEDEETDEETGKENKGAEENQDGKSRAEKGKAQATQSDTDSGESDLGEVTINKIYPLP